MAQAAVAGFVRATAPTVPDVYIIDDASASNVDVALAEHAKRFDCETWNHRLHRSLRFRGCISRTVATLRLVVETGRDYDRVVRNDPDTMVIRSDLCREFGYRGMAGAGL